MLWSLLACRFHDSDFSLTQELISQQAKMDPTSTRKAPSLSSYAPLLSSLCFSGDVEGWEGDFEAGGLVQKLQKRELIATNPIHNQQTCHICFLEAGWDGKDLLKSTCPFFSFQLFNRSITGGICSTQCYRTLALVVGFFELGRHQLSCRFSRDAGLGGRGSKNWGAVLATPHLGENRQLRVLYLCNKKVRVKMESSGGTSQPQTMWS